MSRQLVPLVLAACVLLGASAGLADIVTLSDGSRLIGTVERMGDGKLILVTQFAGTIEIDSAMVTTIETDEPVNVGMDTGDRLVGPVEWRPEIEKMVVQTELAGVPVNVERIEAIWPKDGKSPEVLAMEAQVEKIKAEADARMAKWTTTFEAGVTYKEGNKNILDARGKATLKRKSVNDLLRFYVSGAYSEENDDRSENEIKGGTYYEYLFTERLFAFWRLELEYDEFEDIDLRLSTALGPGYYWIKEDDHELKTRAGIGYLHETYMDGSQDDRAEGEVGLEYRIDIAPWLQFTNTSSWYPTFETLRDYRLVSDSAFIIPLSDDEVWKLKLGALYEYDSLPASGRKRLDQTYYANIVVELK